MNSQSVQSKSSSQVQVNIMDLPDYYPSLCVPRMFPNITEQRIADVFKALSIGEITKIDLITTGKEDAKGNKFKMAFVHIKWNYTKSADKVRLKLINEEEVKLVYDEPWFWKIVMNKKVVLPQKRIPLVRTRPPASKPTLIFVDDDETPKQLTREQPREQQQKLYDDQIEWENKKEEEAISNYMHIRSTSKHSTLEPPQQKYVFEPKSPLSSPPTSPTPKVEICDDNSVKSNTDTQQSQTAEPLNYGNPSIPPKRTLVRKPRKIVLEKSKSSAEEKDGEKDEEEDK